MKRMNKVVSAILVVAMIAGIGFVDLSNAKPAVAKKKAKTQYMLMVNKRRCVVTAYKKVKGKWKPVRAMLCSPGGNGHSTPSGNFRMGLQAKWHPLMHGVWGKYISQITGDILFHSVWYYRLSNNSQSYREFNKLGRGASHGCVRLSVIDSRWIYDHCGAGTGIKIYSSSKAGPLGKPKKLYSKSGWDPTDITKGNPNFKLRKATIKIKKTKTVQYGKKYNLKSGVKVINSNANENITSLMKVSVTKYKNKKYRKAKFSTKSLGTYKIKYSVKYKYCRNNSKTIKIKVVDYSAPKINAGKVKKTYVEGQTGNLVGGMTAKQLSGISRLSKVKVYVITPNGSTQTLTYNQAKKYVFNQVGKYTVVYKIAKSKNPIYSAAKNVKIIIDVKGKEIPQPNPDPNVPNEEGNSDNENPEAQPKANDGVRENPGVKPDALTEEKPAA